MTDEPRDYPNSTLVALAIDELYKRLTQALPGVTVWDGFCLDGDRYDELVEIGVQDFWDIDSGTEAARSRLEWAAAMGRQARDEDLKVHILIAAKSRNEVMKDARDKAVAIFKAIDTELMERSLVIAGSLWSLLEEFPLRQGFDPDENCEVHIPITVGIRGRIVRPY